MQRALGYKQDSQSTDDYLFSALVKKRSWNLTVPAEVDYRDKIPNILDQGALGSCVSVGGFGGLRLKHVLDGVEAPKLGNRLHGYWGARSAIGTTEWDSGSQIRALFKFWNEYGYMPEEDTEHGYDIRTYQEMPSELERQQMYDQKNKGQGQVEYHRINEVGEARKEYMKAAIANEGVLEMGVQVTQRFMDHTGSDIIFRPQAGEELVGGHAFYLGGYNKYGVWKIGSWGTGWGDNGIGLLSWDYVLWAMRPDIWVIDKAPYYSGLVTSN